MKTKKKWWKPAVKNKGYACLCCGESTEILPLTTKLYFGFGGWSILRNGEHFFQDRRDVEFDQHKDLAFVESMIGGDTENEYIAYYDSALRSAKYQRHAKDNWVLIETGPGFA